LECHVLIKHSILTVQSSAQYSRAGGIGGVTAGLMQCSLCDAVLPKGVQHAKGEGKGGNLFNM